MSDITDLKAEVLLLYKENAELREQTELLITLLRNDCDIEASWDGLRKFWNIGLTESGCLMRDRACKAEAENAKLRELVKDFLDVPCQCLKCEHYNYEEDRCDLHDRACELGVEVD